MAVDVMCEETPPPPPVTVVAVANEFSITGVCGESNGRLPTNELSNQHFLQIKMVIFFLNFLFALI